MKYKITRDEAEELVGFLFLTVIIAIYIAAWILIK
jgi:hypothetical protein